MSRGRPTANKIQFIDILLLRLTWPRGLSQGKSQIIEKTSLLQAVRTPFPMQLHKIGKIQLFSKIALTFQLILQFKCPLRFNVQQPLDLPRSAN